MGATATRAALADAALAYSAIEQAFVGYVYGDSTSGQRVLYDVGMTGIPIINVNNNCSTGSTALFLARQAVASGAVECALALGFEQMEAGALGRKFNDRASPFERFDVETASLVGMPDVPLALRYFGGAGLAHMQKYGTRMETFAKIRAKANGTRPTIRSPSSEGSHGRRGARRAGPDGRRDDAPDGLPADLRRGRGDPGIGRLREAPRPRQVGEDRRAGDDDRYAEHVRQRGHDARRRLRHGSRGRAAGVRAGRRRSRRPRRRRIARLLCAQRTARLRSARPVRRRRRRAICDDGDNTYGGKVVTNPSGGLLSKGHPLGATGLAQCHELTHQLRGSAGARQVAGARIGLQHNLGLGGACVTTLYRAA
jgi:hypothetical protein